MFHCRIQVDMDESAGTPRSPMDSGNEGRTDEGNAQSPQIESNQTETRAAGSQVHSPVTPTTDNAIRVLIIDNSLSEQQILL